jgi:hypothetical protein
MSEPKKYAENYQNMDAKAIDFMRDTRKRQIAFLGMSALIGYVQQAVQQLRDES